MNTFEKYHSVEIFEEFIVVEEKAITDITVDHDKNKCHKRECGQSHEQFFRSNSKSLSQFAALEFHLKSKYKPCLEIKDIGNAYANVPLAQIVNWEKGTEKFETRILNMGGTVSFLSELSSIVIRILKKRENTGQNPCPPLKSPGDELTVHIGGKQIIVSASQLMSMSPVISRMLNAEMHEKQQRSLTLDQLDADMEQFMEFLEAISPVALQTPILPNPKNVLVLLKLAVYFQVDWLKSRCEMHLFNCVELPLIDRFLLIDHYRLDNLKMFFKHLGAEKLREFYKAHQEQFLPGKAAVSNELLVMPSGT